MAKTARISVGARMAENVRILMECAIVFRAGKEIIVRRHVRTQLGATTAKTNASASTMLDVASQMDFVFVNRASWVRSARKFAPKGSTALTASRFAAAAES